MMRRSAASSSGVQAANDLSRRTSASEAISPRLTSSSSPDSPGSVAGISSTDWAGVAARMVGCSVSASDVASRSSRKNRRNTRSYTGIWSRRVTIVVRPAQ